MTSPDWTRPLVYFSIDAVDPERQRAFYSSLFNWDIAEGPLMQIPAGIGGPENGISGHISPSGEPGFQLYFQVRDLHESLELARSLGARSVREPFQIPGGATIAGVVDPEGNKIVLVQQ